MAKIRPGDAAVLDEAAVHAQTESERHGQCEWVYRRDRYRGIQPETLVAARQRGGQLPGASRYSRKPADTARLRKTIFVASNDTPEGRAQNRRVELVPVH